MTLDEAIKHCEEVAEQQRAKALSINPMVGIEAAECIECAADHRQLAEWLRELKELRNSIGAVKLGDMKEAVKLISELNEENSRLTSQLTEYKWLLKAAVEDFDTFGNLNAMTGKQRVQSPKYRDYRRIFDILDHRWRYADEAEKLLGDCFYEEE